MNNSFFSFESMLENAHFAVVGLLASLWRYLDPEKEALTWQVKLLRGVIGAIGGVVVGLCAPASWDLHYKLSVAAAFAAFQREIVGALKKVVIDKIK